jgi:pSer/pThr/pTyr-binding forkhead associated (FHA) protein
MFQIAVLGLFNYFPSLRDVTSSNATFRNGTINSPHSLQIGYIFATLADVARQLTCASVNRDVKKPK